LEDSAVPYSEEMVVFSGNASFALSRDICEQLDMPLGGALVGRFSDGEVQVQLQENVRGKDVFIINSTCPPVNDHLMELLILIDAAERASAARVTAVLPYFGYARQDRKDKPRVPITAKLVSNLIVAAGADRVLAVDLHCGQVQGFFDIPVDHLDGAAVFVKHVRELNLVNTVVIAPDSGGVERARHLAKRLEAPLAIVDKRRPRENEAEIMNVIGEVDGKSALIFDDLIDTGGTLVKAAAAIKERGALKVLACSTHAVFSGRAVETIRRSVLEDIWVSNSIPLSADAAACPKVKVVSFAPLIAEAILRIHEEESVSSLFE
jgi:ribose-phosphate pyrophosphokinase